MTRWLLVGLMAVTVAACASDSDFSAAEPVETATSRPALATPTSEAAPSAVPVPTAIESPEPTPTSPSGSDDGVPQHDQLRHVASTTDGAFHYYIDEEPGWTSIRVDRGHGLEPAMDDELDRYVFGSAPQFEVDADGVVRFVHESSGSYWVFYTGRVDESGLIRDVHTHGADAAVDDVDGDRHDAFIDDDADLVIELENPLADVMVREDATIGGWWYRGISLSNEPGCGGSTLYADDADGYRRVLPEGTELDTVVAIHASPVTWLEGADALATSRSLLFSTACPEQYEGVRIVRGIEVAHAGEGSPAPGQNEVFIDQRSVVLPGGQAEARQVVDFYELPAPEFGLSSTQVITIQHLDGQLETFAIDDYGESITSVERGYRADEATQAISGYLASPVESERLSYPYANELLVSDIAIAVDEAGAATLVVVGHNHVQVLREGLAPFDHRPAEPYGEYAIPTAIVSLNDEFVLAVGDYDTAGPLLPAMLRWDAATETWLEIDTAVTRAASYSATAFGSTPPSPPFQGATAITDMVEYDGTIWATGWATIDGAVGTALWRSFDGANWSLEVVPAISENFGPEYGQALSVNSLGVTISIGNGTHYGAGILGRTHGGEWSTLPFPNTDDATSIARVVSTSGDLAWVSEQYFQGSDEFAWSDDLVEWTHVEWPALEDRIKPAGFPEAGFWTLDPDHRAGPIGWYSTYDWASSPMLSYAWQWHVDLGRFVTTPVPGHYVGSTGGYVVTQQRGSFLLIPIEEVAE